MRILLVDDSRADRFRIRKLLEKLDDSDVEEACDGTEAVTKASGLPHLVLMDTYMPGMKGYEACAQIRSKPYGNFMAIIGMSSMPRAKEWKAAGADDFIDKTNLLEGDGAEFEGRIMAAVGKYKK